MTRPGNPRTPIELAWYYIANTALTVVIIGAVIGVLSMEGA
jgi:hypothetical protein